MPKPLRCYWLSTSACWDKVHACISPRSLAQHTHPAEFRQSACGFLLNTCSLLFWCQEVSKPQQLSWSFLKPDKSTDTTGTRLLYHLRARLTDNRYAFKQVTLIASKAFSSYGGLGRRTNPVYELQPGLHSLQGDCVTRQQHYLTATSLSWNSFSDCSFLPLETGQTDLYIPEASPIPYLNGPILNKSRHVEPSVVFSQGLLQAPFQPIPQGTSLDTRLFFFSVYMCMPLHVL